MNRYNYNAPFEMSEITEPQFPETQVYSSDFSSIQGAVSHCASMGGGTVIVPKGE